MPLSSLFLKWLPFFPGGKTHSAFRESPKEKKGMERRARRAGHNI
jgi:hypothetical protein